MVGYIRALMLDNLGKQSNGQNGWKSTCHLLGTNCPSFDHRSTFDKIYIVVLILVGEMNPMIPILNLPLALSLQAYLTNVEKLY